MMPEVTDGSPYTCHLGLCKVRVSFLYQTWLGVCLLRISRRSQLGHSYNQQVLLDMASNISP